MDKVIELKTNTELFYKHYLQILNGIAGLSEKETQVLAKLMEHTDLIDDNIEEALEYKSETATVNRLKKKGILQKLGDHFHINKSIYVPRQENCNVIFRLKYV